MKQTVSPKLIRASAGTGKTFRLANRYIDLLLRGEHPEKILATTFTRKAAAEIRERVFKRLAKAASSDDEAEKLAKDLGFDDLSATQAQQGLRRLTDNQHRLTISTLDSLFFQIAAAFSAEMGLTQGWVIADETNNQKVLREAIRSMFTIADGDKLVRLLLRISSGSYTSGIERRILREVIALHQLFRDSPQEAWEWSYAKCEISGSELEALQAKLLEISLPKNKDGSSNKAWLKARDQGLEDFKSKNWLQFCSRGFGAKVLANETKYYNHEISDEVIVLCRRLLQYVQYQVLSFIKEQTLATRELISLYDSEYDRIRQIEHSLGFDDIKHKLINASFLGQLDEVYYRLDTKISHLLLDEFQDTSNNEWRVLSPIVDEVLSKADSEYFFFCVGDVKQAIYGWRGGNAEIFDHLELNWPQIDIEPLNLTFRCAPAIVDCVNEVFSNLDHNQALVDDNEAATDWQRQYQLHQSAVEDCQGYVEFREVEIGEVQSSGEISSKITTAQKKEGVLKNATWLIKDLVFNQPNAKIGVLTRTNNSASQIVQMLADPAIGIRASEEGKSPLISSIAVQLIMSALRVAQHPGDTISAFHVATSMLGTATGLTNFSAVGERLSFSRSVRRQVLLDGIGAVVKSYVNIIADCYNTAEKKKLRQFAELAYRFDHGDLCDLDEFLRYIETEVVDYNEVAQVRVMTIHQAKGLEFDVVILPDLMDNFVGCGREPVLIHKKSSMSPPQMICRAVNETLRYLDPRLVEMGEQQRNANIKEALCLLYVGLTRARTALFLLTAKKSKSATVGTTFADVLSCALKNLPGDVVYQHGDINWKVEKKDAEEGEGTVLFDAPRISVPKRRTRTLLRQTPSELEGCGIVELSRILNFRNKDERDRSLLLGLSVHRIFEQLRWLKDNSDSDHKIKDAASEQNGDRGVIDEAAVLVKNVLNVYEIHNLFKLSSYRKHESQDVKLYVEHPFAFRIDDRLISGIIDRLVVVTEKDRPILAEIIDFKTDWVNDDVIGERAAYYMPQIEAYRMAVQKLTKLEKADISAKLVFVRGLKVVSI